MRIRYLFIVFFTLPFYPIFTQEDPRFTLSPWLQPFYNPGAMGENDYHLNFTGILRQHSFLSYEAPKENSDKDASNDDGKKNKGTATNGEQILLNIDSYIKQIKGAVGIMFLKDKNTSYFDNIGFKVGYASKIRIRGGKLGIGVQLGFMNIKVAESNFNPIETDDNTLNLLKGSDSFLDFDMNIGLHYSAPNWYVGASCTQLLGGVRISGETKTLKKTPQQMYFTGGYIWNLNTAVPWTVEPHALIKTNFKSWTLDLMALARYNGILWFGLSYQVDWAIAVLFGAVPFYNSTNNYLKGIELGLSYSFPTTKLGYRQGGSMGDFEILVRYGFNFYKEKALTGYGSSRHLYKNQ